MILSRVLPVVLALGGPVAMADPVAAPRPEGFIRIPTDDILPHRGLAVIGGGHYDPGNTHPGQVGVPAVAIQEGFLGRLEVGVSGVSTRPDGGLGGVDLRCRLLSEDGAVPAITAGGLDLSGESRGAGQSALLDWRDWRHHLDRLGVYAVAAKDLGGLGRAVVGVGDSHYLGRLEVDHHGAGAFGGAEISLHGPASAVAEYDGAHVNAGLRMTMASPPLGGSRLVLRALIGGADLLDRDPRKPALAFRLDLELRPLPVLAAGAFLPGAQARRPRARAATVRPREERPTAARPHEPTGEVTTVAPRAAETGTESSRVQVLIDTVQSHLDLIRGSGFAPLVDNLLTGAGGNLSAARERLAAGDLASARRAAEQGGEQARLARQKIEEETQQPMRW